MNRREFFKGAMATTALNSIAACCKKAPVPAPPERINYAQGSTVYTRMFPDLARSPSVQDSAIENGLVELAGKMIDCESPTSPGFGTPDAGYTYLGQFIDHDLTFDVTPLRKAHPHADRTVNFRTPFLDLDHVYGGGPTISPFLYDRRSAVGEERFVLGETAHQCGETSIPADLPRNIGGTALLADPRQDENLVLAQMHVAFLKFHNRLLDQPELLKVSPYREAGSLFESARRFVTWHYQWYVTHDFLPRVICPDTLRQIGEWCCRRESPTCFRIPIEFSIAAFRFGHSLVRDKYAFNDVHNADHPADLAGDLLRLVGASDSGMVALPKDWVIKWPFFFEFGSFDARTMRSRNFDTKIARGLHTLTLPTVKLFNAMHQTQEEWSHPPPNLSLPARTLLRGSRAGLPTGQDVAKALGNAEIDVTTGDDADVLKKHGFDTQTPLWYYILKESSLKPGEGTCLGATGSRIVGQVLNAALRADPDSYLSVAPDWKPTLPYAAERRFRDILTFTFPELGP